MALVTAEAKIKKVSNTLDVLKVKKRGHKGS